MPTILVNNATSIEIDISSALKYTINKGDFDVVLEHVNTNVDLVVIVLRSAAITNNHFYLDWREISSPVGITSAEQLRDLILSWNTPSVLIAGTVPLPTGAATEAKQDDLLTELQKKADLTETQPISAASLPLPAGAATAANQTNGTQKAIILGADGSAPTVEDRKQTPTGKALNVQIGPGDVISNVPVVIDFDHHQVHEGETYKALDAVTTINTNTVKYGITVPVFANPIQGPHMVIQADTYNGSVRVDIYEVATFTGGALLTANNRNRNVGSAPQTTIKTGVTSTNGTLIESFLSGSASRAAGADRKASEWVLKSNTIYRVDVVGQIAQTVVIMSFNWYEDLGV